MLEDGIRKKIVDVLGKHWPISAKQLYTLLKEKHAISISYHGVYKFLQELVEKKIVLKKDRTYLLNKDWIINTRDFFDDLEYSYVQDKKFLDDKSLDLKFETLYDLYLFILRSVEQNFFDKDFGTGYGKFNYFICPFTASRREFNLLREMSKRKGYVIVKNNTPFDRLIEKFFRGLNLNTKLGVDFPQDYDVIVHGDCVLNIFYEPAVDEIFSELYNSLKSSSHLNMIKIYRELFSRKIDIHVTLMRNKRLADEYKKEIESHFLEQSSR